MNGNKTSHPPRPMSRIPKLMPHQNFSDLDKSEKHTNQYNPKNGTVSQDVLEVARNASGGELDENYFMREKMRVPVNLRSRSSLINPY
jgi:hypothetical protein